MENRSATFTVRITVDDDSDINPLHLCEEMQAYLNNNGNNKISGYTFNYDKFLPFIPQEEY